MIIKNGIHYIEDRPPTEEEMAESHRNMTEKEKAFVDEIIRKYEEKQKKQNNKDN
jgi:hypothetical protein